MKNMMTYKGFVAHIEFDERDNIFVGKVIGIDDSITFHAETIKELRSAFRFAINHYLADCKASGRKPFKQPLAKIMLRVSPDTHAKALALAKANGKSLNQWATEIINKAIDSCQVV